MGVETEESSADGEKTVKELAKEVGMQGIDGKCERWHRNLQIHKARRFSK